MENKSFELRVGTQTLKIEFGRMAAQADGAVLVSMGHTSVLVTAVMGRDRVEMNYMPLMVDYEERLYASGKIKGSRFIKREGRPSDESVLTGRLVDRAVRPFFDERLRYPLQVVVTVLSMDNDNDPDVPSLIGASLALGVSDIPWSGLVAAVRVAYLNGEIVVNPTFSQREAAQADIIVTFNEEGRLVMMEAEGKMVSEDLMVKMFEAGQKEVLNINKLQREILDHFAIPKRYVELDEVDKDLEDQIRVELKNSIDSAIYGSKSEVDAAKRALLKDLNEKFPDNKHQINVVFEKVLHEVFKKNILEQEKRPDGRKLDEVRPLSGEIDVFPRTHGVGIFQRGNTQVLTTLTLGSPGDAQIVDGMEEEFKKHFMHHYNFPPFCVGEVRPMRGPGRREIGHGALAERALYGVIPTAEDFPYTIRLVSEVLESNGSSSMASVCASTLAMMAGGVPLKEPVAGIAMGIVEDSKSGVYKILTDIQGPEDHLGEMDFKVAGTRTGINAIQMDIKGRGMDMSLFAEALEQAKDARLHILDVMASIIDKPREEVSEFAPKIKVIKINPEKIGDVIGSGGKIINKIIDETGVKIDIEDDGTVFITCENKVGIEKAVDWIERLTYELKVGDEFDGQVVQTTTFGAFIELIPGVEALLHISEMSTKRIEKVEEVMKKGDKVKVKVKRVDEQGRASLSLVK
jgi:polyribonucleotide nucleotidyltransferase